MRLNINAKLNAAQWMRLRDYVIHAMDENSELKVEIHIRRNDWLWLSDNHGVREMDDLGQMRTVETLFGEWR